MATAQVVSATTAIIHDEKIDEQTINKPQEDIKSTINQETPITAPPPQEVEQPPKEACSGSAVITAEPEQAATIEPEPEALAVEVETKAVVKEEPKPEEEGKVSPEAQPAKVAPEPCVEAKDTKESEPEPEPEAEPAEKEEEVVAAE